MFAYIYYIIRCLRLYGITLMNVVMKSLSVHMKLAHFNKSHLIRCTRVIGQPADDAACTDSNARRSWQ